VAAAGGGGLGDRHGEIRGRRRLSSDMAAHFRVGQAGRYADRV
jgi:hypothetical protein